MKFVLNPFNSLQIKALQLPPLSPNLLPGLTSWRESPLVYWLPFTPTNRGNSRMQLSILELTTFAHHLCPTNTLLLLQFSGLLGKKRISKYWDKCRTLGDVIMIMFPVHYCLFSDMIWWVEQMFLWKRKTRMLWIDEPGKKPLFS